MEQALLNRLLQETGYAYIYLGATYSTVCWDGPCMSAPGLL